LIALVLGGIAGCGGDGAAENRHARSRAPAEARKCLDADGFQTRGVRVPDSDRDAPDDVLLAYTNGSHAEIGFYDTLARARDREPHVRVNADRANAEFDSGGRALIVWITGPAGDVRKRVVRCVFG
jgi:hypothetical protein